MIIKDYMDTVGLRSIEASHELQSLSTDDKNKLLLSIADSIRSKTVSYTHLTLPTKRIV